MKRNHDFEIATRLLDFGRAREALIIADAFLSKGDEASQISGHLCRGMVYEDGGDGVIQDYEKAMDSYRRVSLLSPCSNAFVNLARVSMKRVDGYSDARRFLDGAASYGVNANVALCFAWYYETKPEPELEYATECYARASKLWRVAGFSGYSRVARRAGLQRKAMAVDALRIALTPILILLIGARARFTF